MGDSALRRIFNHTPQKSDVLHRYYVQLGAVDMRVALERMQVELSNLAGINLQQIPIESRLHTNQERGRK